MSNRPDLKITMRSQVDVLVWTLIITDAAVIGTVGYYRVFVSPALYAPVQHHAITIAALLGATLGYFGCWQIMLGQNHQSELRQLNETDTLTSRFAHLNALSSRFPIISSRSCLSPRNRTPRSQCAGCLSSI